MAHIGLGLLVLTCLLTSNTKAMSMDQLIASASKVNNLDYLSDPSSKTVMHELDMVFTLEQWEAYQGKGSRSKRKATKNTRVRWTDKTVPFKKANVFETNEWSQVLSAMAEWEKYTCLRFVEKSSSHSNYIFFDDARGCWSYVGMLGGQQTIGLAGGCRVKGVIVHEIGHAVGFHHEQNRPDRDQYVQINFDNIPKELHYNFKRYPETEVTALDVPYDFGSVMHYGGYAFSHNGKVTIQTRDKADQSKIGNRDGLSFYDIKLANLMYSCHENCDASIQCPKEGFKGKDCKCYCPGDPVQECGGTTVVTTTKQPEVVTTAPPQKCEDMNKYCPDWAKAEAGYCATSTYMKLYCKSSCELCDNEPRAKQCSDERKECAYWAGEGYCKDARYQSFLEGSCAKSCEVCRSDEAVEGSGTNSGVSSSVAIHGLWGCVASLEVVLASIVTSLY